MIGRSPLEAVEHQLCVDLCHVSRRLERGELERAEMQLENVGQQVKKAREAGDFVLNRIKSVQRSK